jgi:protein arginine kinase
MPHEGRITRGTHAGESWSRMVLRSLPPPAWLAPDAPQVDVALSSRVRIARNLRGFRMVHHASVEELREIQKTIVQAASGPSGALAGFSLYRELSAQERDHLVGCRLVSPDFKWDEPGRSLWLDLNQESSVMVNEEDHIRLQSLSAGWSIATAESVANQVLLRLEERLDFAESPLYGYLAASPYNSGSGKRLSGMFHLIGLASSKKLPSVLKALAARGLYARGLFGESSRAVGAFLQVSVNQDARSDFVGACEYLLKEERDARRQIDRDHIEGRALQAIDLILTSRTVTLADALRLLAWLRWGAVAGVVPVARGPRDVDYWLANLEIHVGHDGETGGRTRADYLRRCLAGEQP